MRVHSSRAWFVGLLILLSAVSTLFLYYYYYNSGLISFGLPHFYNPDEPIRLAVLINILNGDLNPNFFQYPSLFFYINAIILYLTSLIPWIDVVGNQTSYGVAELAMGVAFADAPELIIFTRSISVMVFFLGIVTSFVFIAKRTGFVLPGFFGALLVLQSPTLLNSSFYFGPDVFVTVGILFSLIVAVWFAESPSWERLYWLGFASGVVASCKYNGAFIFFAYVAFAPFHYGSLRSRASSGFLKAGSFALLGFVIGTPFALVEPQHFLDGLSFEMSHYSTGHYGMEGGAIWHYLGTLIYKEGILTSLFFVGAARVLYVRDKTSIYLYSFPCLYLLWVATYEVRNDRVLMLILPLILVFAFLEWMRIFNKDYGNTVKTIMVRCGCFAFLSFSVWQSSSVAWSFSAGFKGPMASTAAAEWINKNIAPESSIVLESYGPYLRKDRYQLKYLFSLYQHSFDELGEQPIEYVVAAERMYGRFYREPEKYSYQMQRYEELKDRLDLVKEISGVGGVIKIYKAIEDDK